MEHTAVGENDKKEMVRRRAHNHTLIDFMFNSNCLGIITLHHACRSLDVYERVSKSIKHGKKLTEEKWREVIDGMTAK